MTDPDPSPDVPDLERRAQEGLAFIARVQRDLCLALERHGDALGMSSQHRWLLIHAVIETLGVLLQEAIAAQGDPARARALEMARDLALFLHAHPGAVTH